MKEPCQHLLDTIYPNNSLLLLEAMIPYVDTQLKLPLALLIKVQEIQLLTQVLSNPARMESCGLNRSHNSSEEMISVLCRVMGIDYDGQIKNIMNMMSMMNAMNSMNDGSHSDIMHSMNQYNYTDMMNNMNQDRFTDMMNNGNLQNIMNMMNNMNTTAPTNVSEDDTVQKTPTDTTTTEYTEYNNENTNTDNPYTATSSKDTRNDMIDAIRQILSEQEGDSYES